MELRVERESRIKGSLRVPAVVFIVVYAGLLLCIPSQLIVQQIGAPGTPANLWGLLALLWWVSVTLGGRNPNGRSPVRLAIGILSVAVLSGYFSGVVQGWYGPPNIRQDTDLVYDLVPVTVDHLTEKMISAADRGLLSFFGWVGIVLLTVDGLRSWRDLELLVKWITFFAAFVAALGIIQFFSGLDIAAFFRIPGLVANSDFGAVDTRSVLRRVSATAVHPIEFGVVMAAVFPIALHRTINDWRAMWTWVPTILIGIAIPLSVSRSAVLVTGVALVILFIGWPVVWRRRALLVAPMAIIAMRVAVPGLVGTIVSLFTNFLNDPSITGRTDDYTVVLALYGDHPWFGRGLFTFVPRYYRILDNQFLMSLVELGLIGFIAMVTFFLAGYFSARGARRRSRDPRSRNLALSLSASIAGIVLSYATFDAWGFPMAAGMTFLLIGMAGASWQISDQERRARRESEYGASGNRLVVGRSAE